MKNITRQDDEIKIKLTGLGAPKNANISQFLGNNDNKYKNCKFSINSKIEETDYWIVCDNIGQDHTCKVDPTKIFFCTAESPYITSYKKGTDKIFLRQFTKIFTCHDIYQDNVIVSLAFQPWMINAKYHEDIFASSERDYNYLSQLKELEKTRTLSVFCSNKKMNEHQELRLRFVINIKKYFKDKLDWFGGGIKELSPKWLGIAPYKYHLALENQSTYNVISEKLFDSFLGLSYPIYWGAPNVGDYFPKASFTSINIMDLKGSIEIIEKVIEENTWETNFEAILQAKDLSLNKYNLFMRIAEICIEDYNNNGQSNNKSIIELKPRKYPGIGKKILFHLGKKFLEIYNT